VIRLLLSGVDPARILCVTFTKAAAANMANRVFETLRTWTLLDDAALDRAMRASGATVIDGKLRRRARQLFALALETPGGLKVRTIHAFCTQLLHLFPFEANVAARFEVLDEATEGQMLDKLSLGVMLKAASEPDSALGRALGTAVLAAADVTFQEMVRETIRKRDMLVPWVEAAGGLPEAIAQLSGALGVRPDETMQQIEAAFFAQRPHRQLRMGGGRRGVCPRLEDRQGSRRAVCCVAQAQRCRPARSLSRHLLHRGARQDP